MPDTDVRPITRALISVSDKSGLVKLGRILSSHNIEILSTGGSATTLREGGVKVRDVSDYTDFPEMMDGRVKTLHPRIYGGILARRDSSAHARAMEDHGISAIDLVVVNLYPFEDTVASGATSPSCIESIDIGGPALIRAAAKNHTHVTVVVDPSDYDLLGNSLQANKGTTNTKLRQTLAAKAFAHTASYDAAISSWFNTKEGELFPERLVIPSRRQAKLRYGENPHQEAALYVSESLRPGAATAQLIQGKELSYNNLNDTDAAFELIAEFESPAVAIIKHANPCGVALGASLNEAYQKALACDPVSAFGGVIAFNRSLDAETAREVNKLFTEVIIAPAIDEEAKNVLVEKKNLRVLVAGSLPDVDEQRWLLKSIAGGYLVQNQDCNEHLENHDRVVTKRNPTTDERNDLAFAFTVAKHVKSNAIVYAKRGATVGVGAGQMSRVDSANIAALKARGVANSMGHAETQTIGSVVASDAFFPFADALLTAAQAGATAVIQPGGSIRDDEVIAAADENGLAMIFTGIRHFRH